LGHVRVIRTASDDDTNARSRTESQSFLHRARDCNEWPDKRPIRFPSRHQGTLYLIGKIGMADAMRRR
jgi:hypothetical protein